jgi:hypothetical protein
MAPVEEHFSQLDVPEHLKPVVHYGGSLAAINKDDTFSTVSESAALRNRNPDLVAVGMNGYENISAMLLGGMIATVGLVTDLDNSDGEEVNQEVINDNIRRFGPVVKDIVKEIIARGEYIDSRIGLSSLKKAILNPKTPLPEVRVRDSRLETLLLKARELDCAELQYPEFYGRLHQD